jgi:hypothetical protein
MKHDPKAFDALPHSVIDIAEALGLRVALGLMQNFGGLDVKFPTKPPSDHPIILALGESDGIALCHYLSGQQMYVPHGRGIRSIKGEVQRLEAKGLDRKAIAKLLGVSQRHVRRVANAAQDSRQGDLFSE